MLRSKIILFILFISYLSCFGQEPANIKAYIKNETYTERPSLVFYLVNERNANLPSNWVTELNKWIKGSIPSTPFFTKTKFFIDKEYGLSSGHNTPSHYVAKFEIIDVFIDGKRRTENPQSKKAEYTISANFRLIDLIKGTNVLYETMIFSGVADNNYDEEFIKKMSKYFQENIKLKIDSHFPKIYEIKELGKVSKNKVKSIYFRKGPTYPKYLYAYIYEKTIGDKDQDPIYIFKEIGSLHLPKNTGNFTEYKVYNGKDTLFEYYNNETPIYITTLLLGK